MKIYTFNNKIMSTGGKWMEQPSTPPPGPSLPSDTDFVYLAKNFDGTKIVNVISGSTFGDYLAYGTITSNGSGSSCYLSNGLDGNNYLYKTLTTDQLDNIKAVSGTYTWFIRMMQIGNYSGTCGGIMSTRFDNFDNYMYMLRCEDNQLQLHMSYGINLGSDFMMNADRVYKVQISGSSFIAKNLETGVTSNNTFSTDRVMGTTMTTFSAGYFDEYYLDRFYGFAGIARATTAAEDEDFKTALMNQAT